MRHLPTRRQGLLLTLGALAGLTALWLYPVGTSLTRSAGLFLAGLGWLGLLAACWPGWMLRLVFLSASAGATAFLALPAAGTDREVLRELYLRQLRSYGGVRYHWGGESPLGIDCSGLIRRGLIEAQCRRALATLEPGLLRRAFALWWNDTSAHVLGEGRGPTFFRFETASLNEIDHSQLLPGDLAVTRNGAHILAYLGAQHWIQADPNAGRVVTVTAPSASDPWFRGPMRIVRWRVLDPVDGGK